MFINLQQAALLPLMTWEVVKLLVAPNLFCPQQVLEEIGSHAQRGWQQLLCLTQNFWLITAVLKMGFYTWVWGGGWRKSNVHLKLHKKYPKNIFLWKIKRVLCTELGFSVLLAWGSLPSLSYLNLWPAARDFMCVQLPPALAVGMQTSCSCLVASVAVGIILQKEVGTKDPIFLNYTSKDVYLNSIFSCSK